jgi:hypothetical protein
VESDAVAASAAESESTTAQSAALTSAASSSTQPVDISELERVSRISLSVPAATQQVDIAELEEVLDAHFAAKAATVIDEPKFDPVTVRDASETAEPLSLEPRAKASKKKPRN